MAITSSELSNKTAPNGSTYQYAYVCYDTNIFYDGNYQIRYENIPVFTDSGYGRFYAYFRPQAYYSISGNNLNGTLYFCMQAQGNGFSTTLISYTLKVNFYNASKQYIGSQTVVNKQALYKAKTVTELWNTDNRMYNWNLKKFYPYKGSILSYPALVIAAYGEWPPTYRILAEELDHQGAQISNGDTWISEEGFWYRYASDTSSVHYRNFAKYSNTPKKIDKNVSASDSKHPLKHRSAPANGGCKNFSATLPSGTAYISFTLTSHLGNRDNYDLTFPDYGGGEEPLPVATYSHFYRYNGSSWQRVATANYMFPGWDHVKIYKYNGSHWEPGSN